MLLVEVACDITMQHAAVSYIGIYTLYKISFLPLFLTCNHLLLLLFHLVPPLLQALEKHAHMIQLHQRVCYVMYIYTIAHKHGHSGLHFTSRNMLVIT
jgi:hypothetical protein